MGVRLAQLLVLAAVAQTAPVNDRAAVLASFGVVAAFAVFSDAGGSSYLLTRDQVSRRMMIGAATVQGTIAFAGAVLATAFSMITLPWEDAAFALLYVGCYALSQALDSATRAVRAVQLQAGRDLAYAFGDGALGATKLILALVGLLLGSMAFVLALPAASLVVLTTMFFLAWRSTSSEGPGVSVGALIQFGISGAVSGIYTQVPFLIATAVAPVAAVASLAIALRVIQPLEILPATASQQLMPRIRARPLRARPIWIAAVATGGLLAPIVWAATPLLQFVFDTQFEPSFIVGLLCLTVPLKFGNYMLTAFLLARGQVNHKTLASLIVGVLAVVGSLLSVPLWGTTAAVLTMVGAEVILGIILATLIRHRQQH
ncbi:hypothetical protein ACFC3F_13000 [Microbacterium sp. NPDC055910]|uniref:hypothetical protein n=1 Tax=Microbacterium sp. NPDC055910 TaxID=3345659 RepID=UPI0035D59765